MIFLVFFIPLLFSEVLSLVTGKDYSSLPPVFHIDDFDRCMLLGDDSLYCTIDFQLTPVDAKNPKKIWNQIAELSKDPKNYRHDRLRHGICVTSTCPNISIGTEYLEKCYSTKYEEYGLSGTITEMHCQTNKLPPYDTYDISILFVAGAYSVLLLLASIFYNSGKNGVEENHKTSTVEKILSCFSIQKNWHRLTIMKDSSHTEALQCIQGLRFWNMFLVLSSHAVLCMLHGPIINTKTVEEMVNSASTYLLAGLAPIVTQTFFLISSWLLTYQVFMIYGDGKQLKISHLFVILLKRYIRLTPTLAVLLAIHTTLPKYVAKGPFWYHMIGREYENCRENGWSNLLYINNYINPSRMCMSQTWYLAADTQLFVLGLGILAALKKFPEKSTNILGIGLVLGIFIPGILCFMNGYDILQSYPENLYTIFLGLEDWHVLFSSGYSNIGALLIGISFGYSFYLHRNENIFNTKIREAMVCLIPVILCCLTAATTYFMNYPQYTYSKLNAAFWWSGTKNAVCIAAATFIFGMTEKIGWILLWICCWRPVRYLSRLTYSAFLVHIFLLRAKAASMRSPSYISNYMFVTSIFEVATLSYICALILCLTCEMPISALQKLWLFGSEEEMDKSSEKILPPKDDS